MYDRRLDAVIAAADTGSFAQAARRLHISTPAIAKQITTFEKEYDLTIFDRSRAGVTPTPAGAEFIDDARSLVRESNEIIRRARQRMHRHETPVRLGISILRPARRILDLWQRSGRTGIRLELVSMPDDSTSIQDIIAHLGEDIDVISTAFVPDHWTGVCGTLPLFYEPLCLAVPRGRMRTRSPVRSPIVSFARRESGLPRGNGTDDIARDLLERNPGVTLVDIAQYDLDLFNECAESDDLLISKPMWDDAHPQLVNVPVDWPEPVGMQYGLLYPLSPAPQVESFVNRIAALNRQLAQR
ncbi:LysR family transcriptional regulator [Bifidobacterium sp. 82T10]|uniref:LysR family transcriptional regulator n=1 Tax=Bifidobacterium miconis TaxID=2834435 RepID=A0ABS6WG30_9BIFI|nr:LysR family transcriptional regulator [Bifidobacterium miconis]MBW3092975.1 LysR family transcriptional regulator [Bifidobacterium miconis]